MTTSPSPTSAAVQPVSNRGCDHAECAGRNTLTRRTAIGAGLMAGAATLVSACGAGSTGTTGTAAAAATAGSAIAAVKDIPAGGALMVTAGGKPFALAKKDDGTVSLHSGVCTHQGCAVAADGVTLRCPCHGSEFDAFTGAVLRGPAEAPLPEVAFAEQNGSVVLS